MAILVYNVVNEKMSLGNVKTRRCFIVMGKMMHRIKPCGRVMKKGGGARRHRRGVSNRFSSNFIAPAPIVVIPLGVSIRKDLPMKVFPRFHRRKSVFQPMNPFYLSLCGGGSDKPFDIDHATRDNLYIKFNKKLTDIIYGNNDESTH